MVCLIACSLPLLGMAQHADQKGHTPLQSQQKAKIASIATSGAYDSLKSSQFGGFYFLNIKINELPDFCQWTSFSDKGIRILSYKRPQEYLVAVPDTTSLEELLQLPIQHISPIPLQTKLAPTLAATILANAYVGQDHLKLDVALFDVVSFEGAKAVLTQAGYVLTKSAPQVYRVQVAIPYDRHFEQAIIGLAAFSFVAHIDWATSPTLPANIEGVRRHGASYAQHVEGLDGAGVVIGVGDGGYVAPHVDLDQRVLNQSLSILPSYANHGDHVTGTIGGAGNRLPIHGGIAPGAILLTHQTKNIWMNAPTYFQQHGMVLTNNSYAEPFNCATAGQYTLDSYTIDQQANSLPALLHVFSAANEGSQTCAPFPKGYHTINGGYTSAKNNLVVGALDAAGEIASYSSHGPTTDGRLKPEICAVGTGLMSTVPTDAYNTFSGTSMASATVTGSLALLYQQYRQLYNGANPDAALIKAIVCNTAKDYGLPGPDYRYGFGTLDIQKASATLKEGRFATGSVADGQSQSPVSITVPSGAHSLKIMLCWTDAAALPGTGSSLVNNLDLTVTDPSATTVLPWTLNPNGFNVLNPAVRGVDTLNNMEQVTLTNPDPGTYTVSVTGGNVAVGTQAYYIAYEVGSTNLVLEYPVAGEALVPGEIVRLWWDAHGLSGGNFLLEYSENGGNTWQTISTELITARDRSWQVPASATAQARVRVSHTQSSASSESGDFTIISTPTLSATIPCDGAIDLSWNAINGAIGYDFMMLDTSMKTIDTLAVNSHQLVGLNPTETYWLAVRAKLSTGAPGRRGQAIKVTPSGAGPCPSQYDLVLSQIMKPVGTGRTHSITSFSAAEDLQVEIQNLGTSTVSGFRLCYQVNGGGPIVSDSLHTPLSPGASFTYTFGQQVNLLAAGAYTIAAWVDCTGDGASANDSVAVTVRQLANPPLTLPVTEGFESGIPATYSSPLMGVEGIDCLDYEQGSSGGRLRTDAGPGFPSSGNRAISMDASSSTGTVPHYAILTFNLAAYQGIPNLYLDFAYMHHGEEAHPEDRIWIRGNELDPWLELYNWYDSCGNAGIYHQAEKVPVSALLASANQNLSTTFQIRIGQQDDSLAMNLISMDGLTVDEVKLYQYAPPLSFSCLNPQTLPATTGCDAMLPDYRALLNVGGGINPVVTQIPPNGTPVQGSNTVTLIISDPGSGQSDTCSMQVTVLDNTPPTLICPSPQTLTLDANCQATLPDYRLTASVSDNCGTPIMTQTPVSGVSISSNQLITLTASDGNQQVSCSFALTLLDQTPPTIACPGNQVITLSSNCASILPDYRLIATATDNCTATPTITQTPPSGTAFTNQINVIMTASDGNQQANCSFSVVATTLSLTASHVDPSAAGAQNGSIDLTVAGGVAPFSYQWSNNMTTEDLSNLGGGSYSVTVTDGNGCSETMTITLTSPPPVSTMPELTDGHLTGVGTIWQTVSLTHTYTSMVVIASLVIPNSSLPSAVPRIRNASGSSFEIMVQATNGTVGHTYEVYYVVAEEGVYNVGAHGVKMEVVKVNATQTAKASNWAMESRAYQQSYTAPVVLGQVMTYHDTKWSAFWASSHTNKSDPPTATSFAAGKHVGEDPSSTRLAETIGYIVIEAGTGTLNGVSYLAGLGADIIAGVDNTTTGYAYSLSGFTQPTAAIVSPAAMDGGNGGWPVLFGPTPLTASQLLLAFDEDQSKDTERKHTKEQAAYLILEGAVSNPCPTITLSVNSTDETCAGGDGTATASPSGGNAPYTYSWSNGSTSATLTGLAAGSYQVMVTDANGCTANGSATVVAAPAVSLSISATDVSCFGLHNGTATATAAGGTAPYSYSWSNGGSGATLTGLGAGGYIAYVVDVNGCQTDAFVQINEPFALTLTLSPSNESAPNAGDGNITLTASGGTSPYSYLWSNGATNQDLIGVNGGTYSVTLTDANGCTASDQATVQTNPATGPTVVFEQGVISGVSDFWLTIPLTYTYTEMVVVATIRYPNNTIAPAVTRIRNAANSSFDLMLQNPSGATLGSYEVHYMVAEAGVYDLATHGVKFEAARATSTISARKGSWQREARTYQQSYSNPVVVGQVMSYNDAKWSSFWASESGERRNPPSPTSFAAGKHVGADVVTTRTNETIGYMVFEADNGLVNGIGFEAGVGIDVIKGVQNSAAGYAYSLSGMAWVGSAILSMAGADVGDGGWPVILGSNPLTASQISMAIDEDQIADTERKHGTEQVAYIVFGNTSSNTRLAQDLATEGIRLYPQPAQDWVMLKWANVGEGNYRIDILDVQGRRISSKDISTLTPGIEERISLSHLSPGMYIMRISGNGHEESRKFVKK